MARTSLVSLLILLCLGLSAADIFLHSPRGGNNRLDEPSRDRNNAHRLYDSENNNRGGSNAGTMGREYYYEGSILPISWMVQNGCGTDSNFCQVIIQYYCDDNATRDGLTTNTIPNTVNDPTTCMNGNCDTDLTYGRHESQSYYQNCQYRSRNQGLFTASQILRGNGAIYTRQNPNGVRYGYECPEERDYYPYWSPTQWRDIAIFTNEPQRCAAYQAESQNVKSRWHCVVGADYIQKQLQSGQRDGFIPITEKECEDIYGNWVEAPAFNIEPPFCNQSQYQRDNHLGNTLGGFFPFFNWTIPPGYTNRSCVLRIRYNISSAETHDNNGEWSTPTSTECGNLNCSLNYQQEPGVQENDNDPLAYHYASQVDVWTKYGLTRADNAGSFSYSAFKSENTRGYVLADSPLVDIFGSLVTTPMKLSLAISTANYGRTFQDRSHTFSIVPAPAVLGGATIWNLGVRGKRGNNQQTFPGLEYDFNVDSLHVRQGDFIHFQWTGSNTNPNNNAGQGTQGTDRSNVILLRSHPVTENAAANAMSPFPGHTGSWKSSYPEQIDAGDFLGLSTSNRRTLARIGIYTPYFDSTPMQVVGNPGSIYNYVSTRNHAFTNRDQKAQIVIDPPLASKPFTPTNTANMFQQMVTPDGNAWIRFYPDPTAVTSGSNFWLDTDDQGRVVVQPFLFDVAPPQKVMLDMRYDHGQNIALHVPYILQSDYNDFSYSTELTTSYNGGIASASITRGGYYVVDVRPNAGAVVAVVFGVAAFFGIGAFIYYQMRKRFSFSAHKKIEMMSTSTV